MRKNVLYVLENLESVFTSVYFHYYSDSESEPNFEESIAERRQNYEDIHLMKLLKKKRW